MKFSLKKPNQLINEVMSSSGMLNHIRNESGCTDSEFELRYVEPMHRIAEFVLELPASANHHKEPGGAIRFAIESGFFALRIADSTIFTNNLTAEQRRDIEPQYRYGTFIASLCSNIHRCAAYFDIVTNHGEVWNEFDGSLTKWLGKLGEKDYNIKWKAVPADTNKQVAMFLAKEIMDKCCSHLSPQTIRDIMGSIAPDEVPTGHEPHMTRVVRQSLQTSIDMDIKRASLNYTEPEKLPLPTEALVNQVLPKHVPAAEIPLPTVVDTAPEVKADVPATMEPAINAEPVPVPIPDISNLPVVEKPAVEAEPQDDELFSQLEPSVKEMLMAIKDDVKNGSNVKKRLKWEKDGLSIPSDLLGDYGLASSAVVSALKKVNCIRRKDGTRIVIDQKLGNKVMERADS